METTALVMAYIGVALMVGLAGIASAIGTAIAGHKFPLWDLNLRFCKLSFLSNCLCRRIHSPRP